MVFPAVLRDPARDPVETRRRGGDVRVDHRARVRAVARHVEGAVGALSADVQDLLLVPADYLRRARLSRRVGGLQPRGGAGAGALAPRPETRRGPPGGTGSRHPVPGGGVGPSRKPCREDAASRARQDPLLRARERGRAAQAGLRDRGHLRRLRGADSRAHRVRRAAGRVHAAGHLQPRHAREARVSRRGGRRARTGAQLAPGSAARRASRSASRAARRGWSDHRKNAAAPVSMVPSDLGMC